MSEQELQHWGIKGMKWGIRRFQNRDGTLTSAGKKRYGDGGSDGKSEGKAGSKSESKKPDISKMSDTELRSAYNRLMLERDYKRLYAEMNPAKKTLAKEFIEKAVKPALIESGKKLLQESISKYGMDALNKKATDEYTKLKKKVDLLDLKKKQQQLERDIERGPEDDAKQREFDELKRESAVVTFKSNIAKKNKELAEDKPAETKPKTYKITSGQLDRARNLTNTQSNAKLKTYKITSGQLNRARSFLNTQEIYNQPINSFSDSVYQYSDEFWPDY